MTSKRWLWVIFGIIALILGIFVIRIFNKSLNFDTLFKLGTEKNQETNINSKVISWLPDQATLNYIQNGQTKTLKIEPLHPTVIVPIFINAKLVKEELALTPLSSFWRTAFCSGDTISFENKPTGELDIIRNLGPRPCAD